jgi:hypothetical protein
VANRGDAVSLHRTSWALGNQIVRSYEQHARCSPPLSGWKHPRVDSGQRQKLVFASIRRK